MHKNIIILTGVHPNKVSGKTVTDLKNLLKDQGNIVCIMSNIYLREELEDVISVKSIFSILKSRIKSKIKGLYKKTIPYNKNYYMFSQNSHEQKSKVNLILKKMPFKPDIFIYIFPHHFLNEKDLNEINKRTGAPIYRYMADMVEMTGGCHYAWDCEGYMKSCGKCPGLYSDNAKDITYENLKFKKKYVDQAEIYPIAASEWQFQQLSKSAVYSDKKKFKILLPTDENTFYNRDRNKSRIALGLPLDKKIIFFGAVNTVAKRKGAKELLDALNHLSELLPVELRECIHLAVAGKVDSTFMDQLLFKTTSLGYLDYNALAVAYSASDVFVCPSIEDSGPTMINQALMCKTPVVSFKMGVALDLVENHQTGYLAELGNPIDFAKGINQVLSLNDTEIELMRNNCYLKVASLSNKTAFYLNFSKILNV